MLSDQLAFPGTGIETSFLHTSRSVLGVSLIQISNRRIKDKTINQGISFPAK